MFSPTELRYGLKEDLLGFGESNIELWFEGGEKSALAVVLTELWWISELPPFENDDEKRLQKRGLRTGSIVGS